MPRGSGGNFYIDASEFKAMLGRGSVASAEFKAELRRELRKIGNEAARTVKEQVMLPPESSGHGPHSGLRSRIAGGVKVSVRASGNLTGVYVRSTAPLARQYGNPGGWRAPLFGDRDHWYQHHGRDYFNGPLHARFPAYEAEVQAVLGAAWRRFDGM